MDTCTKCEQGKLIEEVENFTCEYNGVVALVERVHSICNHCGNLTVNNLQRRINNQNLTTFRNIIKEQKGTLK